MKEINITIRDKIAENVSGSGYVCGNSDYTVVFDFDSEWDEFETKTARFIKQDKTFTDVVFSGNQCPMPILSNTYNIYVGVFAGDLHTTTPAHISAKKSILCDGGTPAAPSEDVYAQIIALLNNIEQPAANDIQYQATIEDTPVENVAQALDLLKEGAGGAKTWADLGESLDFEIEWDGSTEGLEVVSPDGNLLYYKVSDDVLMEEDLIGAEVQFVGDAISSLTPYDVFSEGGISMVTVDQQMAELIVRLMPVIVFESDTEYGSAGVYFCGNDEMRAKKLVKYGTIPIPEEYMPKSVTNAIEATGVVYEATEETLTFTFDGSTDGLDTFTYARGTYYKVSDFCPDAEFVVKATTTSKNGSIALYTNDGENCQEYGQSIVVYTPGACELRNVSFTAPSAGTYLKWGDDLAAWQCVEATFSVKNTYLCMVNNGKRYRLKVGYDGTLSATEVTE